jgi:uncharacterized phage protein (TIGR02220 family)
MAVKFIDRVWENSQAKHAELLVMLALADWSNDAGESWPSVPKLAHKARLTDRQTRRALDELVKRGEIRRDRTNGGRNQRNHYFITVSENPDKVTLKKLQGNNYPEKKDQETLVKMSGASNRHITVNKSGVKAPCDFSPSRRERKLTRGAGIPPEFQPIVSRVIARINELAGTQYHDDKSDALHNLLARLREGRTETECFAVIEGRRAAWADKKEMQEYFRPSTLFAAVHFEDYLQAAQRSNGNGHSDGPPKVIKRDGDMLTLADGSITPEGTYQRKYGIRP